MKKPIYMDYAATTPCDRRVLEKMLPYFTEQFGNASSSDHSYGWEAAEAVDLARKQLSALIHADAAELFFTSGATEAVNLAIKGLLPEGDLGGKQILTNRAEHAAVLDTCAQLEARGAKISYLELDQDGNLSLDRLEEQLRERPALLAVQYANNETGVIHPVREIGTLAERFQVPFFCDATQAVGKIPVDVREDKIGLLALSGHKIYGPKGIGALYVRHDLKARMAAQQHGGNQELGLRSGTLNVPGIIGLGEAARLCREELSVGDVQLEQFREELEKQLSEGISGLQVNGKQAQRLPHIANLFIPGINAEQLLLKISSSVGLSRGSACSSVQRIPSQVIMAMGLGEERAHESIRISIGRQTRAAELEEVIQLFVKELGDA